MTPAAELAPDSPTRLTRRRVLDATLAFVDEHGLEALTMRKLGAALGVEGTALYNHVEGKDGLLDGLVELLWSEALAAADTTGSWQDVLRSAAAGLRDVVRRHPQAAPLICRRSLMPVEALELYAACIAPMEHAGFDRNAAAQAVCAVLGHAFGYAAMEVAAGNAAAAAHSPESDSQRIRRVAQMLPSDVPDHLFEIGIAVCCNCDSDAQFATGVDLIIAGLQPTSRPPNGSRRTAHRAR
ncbi:MAG: TetR/AcrR family transcriptional regulator C-terminal domain-containing protein [Acidimicrobiales bacterium]